MEWILVVIFSVLIILVKKNRSKIKGIVGEKIVAQQLEKVILEGYKVLHDVLIKTENGTSQIDHVVISPYGLLVIETKNYKGWIYGKEESDYWTQVIYKGKFKFRNPIKQNWGHICALKAVLPDYKDVPFHSIIVIAGSAAMKTMHDIRTKVIYPDMLSNTILNHRGIQKLKEEDIEKIYQSLKSKSINDKKGRREHINNIKKAIEDKAINKVNMKCPYCGSEMVRRTSKFGNFLGCSRFPKCKFTKRI
jgi:predicted RNA-binding Zn-ribbon protein involved in translation (DUF1610 family)